MTNSECEMRVRDSNECAGVGAMRKTKLLTTMGLLMPQASAAIYLSYSHTRKRLRLLGDDQTDCLYRVNIKQFMTLAIAGAS